MEELSELQVDKNKKQKQCPLVALKKEIKTLHEQFQQILQTEKVNDTNFEMSSLINSLGIKTYYLPQAGKIKTAKGKEKVKETKELLQELSKQLKIKSKYKFKQPLQLEKAQILSTIHYNVATQIELLKHIKEEQNQQIKDEFETVLNDESDNEELNPGPKKDISYKEKNKLLIEEYEQWKKKQGINEKVFLVNGGYVDLKAALLQRNWVENKDESSLYFDFKYTVKKKDIQFERLGDFQVVNHYDKNTSLTTKVGLSRNLRNIIGTDYIDVDQFFPRCYDFNDTQEFEDFIEEFKFTRAESLLKQYFDCPTIDSEISELIFKTAYDICQRKWDTPFDSLIKSINSQQFGVVTQDEWQIIKLKQQISEQFTPDDIKTKLLYLNNRFQLASGDFKEKVGRILELIKQKNPQYYIDGIENIWITKPSALSRGRGIKCHNSLEKLLNYILSKDRTLKWVVQKYMENFILIDGRKFDIRQWVIVSDWNQLKIWFYDECYIRFSAEDYDAHNLNNKFMHLTNNSVAKNSEKFYSQAKYEHNMMPMHEFANFIAKQSGKDMFYEAIQKKMKMHVISSLKAAQGTVQNRKNSFEHFGYDFLIDEQFNPWLIEINSSPSMEYSTGVTEKLVKEAMEDIAKLVADFGLNTTAKKVGKWKLIYNNGEINF